MNTPRIAVTIANWNGKTMLEQCIASLGVQTIAPAMVIVVDNGSTDGSVEWLTEQAPSVHCIALAENTGYAFPHNLAIQTAFGDTDITHVLTLNNDVELTPTFLEEILACADRHPETAAIQGKIYSSTDRTKLDCVGVLIHPDFSGYNRGQHQRDSGQFDAEEEIMGPSASTALYSREALEHVAFAVERSAHTIDGNTITLHKDYFDSDYFAYYEDVDLLWRLRLAGYSAWFTPQAIAYHAQSATGKTASPFKAFHIHRNHFYNMLKDAPLPHLLLALALLPLRYMMLIMSVLRGRGAASRLSENVKEGIDSPVAATTRPSHSGATTMVMIVVRAWKETFFALPALLKKRRHVQGLRTVSFAEVSRWFREYRVSWNQIFFE